jgi:hypothetical protein
MAFDEELAARIRSLIGDEPGVDEKRMFGGLAFLVSGNISVAVSGSGGLLLRCEPSERDALLLAPFVGTFEMQGRAAAGWLRVEAEGVESDEGLERWVDVGLSYAQTLPPKR